MKKILLIIILSFVLLPGISFAAGTKAMGESCESNSECRSGDCEESSKKDTFGRNISYCDCNEFSTPINALTSASKSCLDNWGKAPGGKDWFCRNGGDESYGIDYCQDEVTGKIAPTIPMRGGDILDMIINPEGGYEGSISELKTMVAAPQTKITIPGLNFSDPNFIKENTFKESDGTYMYIPYIGEYLAATYRYAIVFASIFAVMMIINHGFNWAISGGDSEKINHAKTRMVQSVVGLLIAVTSYSILALINPELVQFRSLRIKYVEGMEIFDKGTLLDTGKAYPPGTFDPLFEVYQPCLQIDWKILKAVAYRESGFRPGARSDTGFQGLFQTVEKYCRGESGDGYLGRYGLADKCKDLTDPEVSTMVGVSSMIKAKEIVEKICPEASFESKIFYMYTAHHSGGGGAESIMKKVKALDPKCDWQKSKNAIYTTFIEVEFTKEANRKIMGSATPDGDEKLCSAGKYCAKRHADDGFKGGQVVIDAAKSYGAEMAYKTNDMNKCPLKQKSLIGTVKLDIDTPTVGAEIKPSTDIKCDPKYNGRKILVVGDSITANPRSYALQLKASCPSLNIEVKACGGLGLSSLWNGYTKKDPVKEKGIGCSTFPAMKNEDFSKYNDFVLLGGVNGIGQSVGTTQTQLSNFYQKAKNAKMRIIAITLNPSKGWWENGGEMTDTKKIQRNLDNTDIVNKWIIDQRGKLVDFVVDEYKILDSDNDHALDKQFESGDHLHFNELGHKAVAAELAKQAYQ